MPESNRPDSGKPPVPPPPGSPDRAPLSPPPEVPTEDLPSTAPYHGFAKPPARIGPYRILEVLGEGGMGVVYLAQQEYPVERRVALKVIKLGMDTKEVVARFESERQALALMDHPNIARILEGGITPEGRPFFVMEYVPGESITGYCDRHKLSLRDRLQLFVQVCRGVQHAHQKGIIHRDLKPSNIQVMVQDGKPIPKIIDFGVAKATNRRLTTHTVYTEQGQLIGTPAYMSPEQAEMTGLNVDTTTDIYSLGVLLYELLVGTLPFDPRQMRQMSLDSIHRMIREVDPPRPSTRLTDADTDLARIAQQRRTELGALKRQLRGELDWIVLKSMEKDRTRRYPSASELAADIDRFLHHQPIQAHAPSTVYQLRKMVVRHKTAVSFAATLLVLLLGSGIWMTVLYARASRAEATAAEEAETAKQVSDFLVGLFEVNDPSQALGETITAKSILDEGAQKIESNLRAQPLVQAHLMDTMGQVYRSLGLVGQAESLLENALAIREQRLGPDDPEVATTLYHLAELYSKVYNHLPAKALELHERALDIRLRVLGPDHLDTGWSLYSVGAAHALLGEPEAAYEYLPRAQAIFEKQLGPEDKAVAWCQNDLGVAKFYEGHLEEAIVHFRRALEIKREALDPRDPDIAGGMNALGYCLTKAHRYDEALPSLVEAVALSERVSGPDHPNTAMFRHSLGELYLQMKRYPEARKCFEEALVVTEKAFGRQSLMTGEVLMSLGVVLGKMSEYTESDRAFHSAIESIEASGSEKHPLFLDCLDSYALMLEEQGDQEAAARTRLRADALRATVSHTSVN